MWALLRARLLPVVLLSLFIMTVLFLTIYLPQVAILMLFHRQGSAWVNGTFLVLSEGNLLIALLFEAFLVDKTQVDSFDAVLVAKGHADLVRARRPVSEEGENPIERLGPREKGATFAPFSFRQIIEFVVLLPLNLIPYAGVPLFLLLTGYRAGPLLQHRYHALLGMDKRQRRVFTKTKSMRWNYMWFGTFYLVRSSNQESVLALCDGKLTSADHSVGSGSEHVFPHHGCSRKCLVGSGHGEQTTDPYSSRVTFR